MDVASIERAKYTAVWQHPQYREKCHGLISLDDAIDRLGAVPPQSWADFGCGTGRAVAALCERGFPAIGVDFAENGPDGGSTYPFLVANLWDMPALNVQWGLCTDVMEHIPEQFADLTVRNIAACVQRGCYFGISLMSDVFGPILLGEPLHLTVKPAQWWLALLRESFARVNIVSETPESLNVTCWK